MTDLEINAIVAQAIQENPSVRTTSTPSTSTLTSEETIEDVQAAFLAALGEETTNVESSSTPMNENGFQDEDDELEEDPEEELPENNNTENHNIIPENSASILVDETTSRFSDAIWYQKIQEKVITLAGLGGIGSYVAFLLARMRPRALYLYDDDIVEAANMSGQLYSKTDVEHKKVDAIAAMISNYADFHSVFCMSERYTVESEASDIMLCGFDNMEARRVYYSSWREHLKQVPTEHKKNCLFIDGRLAAESIQVFCITGDDDYNRDRYVREWLFSDNQADATMCSYKQTTFCANMIGSIIVNLFVNFCANECNPLMARDLPFMTSYEAETMYFKTEN